jgi:hypothetical protein
LNRRSGIRPLVASLVSPPEFHFDWTTFFRPGEFVAWMRKSVFPAALPQPNTTQPTVLDMKRNLFLTVASVGVVSSLLVLSLNSSRLFSSRKSSSRSERHVIGARDAHSREWLTVTTVKDPDGQTRKQTRLAYVELATGLHYQENGQWKETQEKIEPSPNGAVALRGPHKLTFAGNLAAPGAIEMETPDGKQLRSHVLGLSYYDAASRQTVLIAEVRDSRGRIVGNNQVVYGDAFYGLKADVRYTYTRAGIEQDVILREQPPRPETFGFNPETTRLQVLTEFLSPPEPGKDRRTWQLSSGTDMVDENLDFGVMKIGNGRAFSTSQDNHHGSVGQISVAKQWLIQGGRQLLLEEVALPDIEKQLRELPRAAGTGPIVKNLEGSVLNVVSADRLLPSPRQTAVVSRRMEIARLSDPSPGLVLDYISLNGGYGSYTFTNGTTYFVTGPVGISGTATFQGGTVIKFTNEVATTISVYAVNCQTSSYRPAFFTSMDDNTVGDIIDGSTGTPNSDLSATGITIQGSSYSATLQNLRFSYLAQGIYFYPEYGSILTLRDSQIRYCGYGVAFHGTTAVTLYAGNVLMDWLSIGVYSDRLVYAVLDYVTADNVTQLAYITLPSISSLAVSNSILARIQTFATPGVPTTAGNNGFFQAPVVGTPNWQTSTTPFTNAGPATHYQFANGPFLDKGLPSVNPSVNVSLRQRTTAVPRLLSGTTNVNTTLSSRGLADLNQPDLGYHYEILDYLAGTNTITTSTLTLTNGVAIGVWGAKGFVLANASAINSTGTPTNPNRIENCREVMEIEGWTLPQDSSGAATIPSTFNTLPVPPVANFKFTRFGSYAAAYTHMQGGGPGTYNYTDCQFSGGVFHNGYGPGTGPGVLIAVTNSLFEQVAVSMNGRLPANTRFFNNLFKDGSLNLKAPAANAVHFYDNLFDRPTIFQFGPAIDHGFNGYLAGQQRLTPNGAGDQVIASTDYQLGPLGIYYYPTNGGKLSVLIDRGSRTAPNAGLADYTTRNDGTPETSGQVDIGFHYPDLNDSTGTDFWTAFPNDWIVNELQLHLQITGLLATSGSVTIPGIGFSKNFTVTPGQVTTVDITNDAFITVYDTITNLGVHVTAGHLVSVNGWYDTQAASESFLVYPTAMLGTNYCVLAHESQTESGHESQMTIVATANNTTVNIEPSVQANIPGHNAPFTVTLQTGDAYQLRSAFSIFDIPGGIQMSTRPTDLTGTFVTSDKPVVILSGTDSGHIPGGTCCSNPLIEQQQPTVTWGLQSFGYPLQTGDVGTTPPPVWYRVLAAYNNTVVTTNGVQAVTLQRGQFYETNFVDAVEFTATKPIQVAEMFPSDGGNADPLMFLLFPTNRWLATNTVSIPAGIATPYDPSFINVIAPASALSGVLINGTPAQSLATFTSINGGPFSGAQIGLAPGEYNVTSPMPVAVQVYGFGFTDGHGYNGGLKNPLLAANPDFYSVALNTGLTADVLANDIFSGRSTVAVSITGNPAHGTAIVTTDKNVYYQPSSGYSGDDELTYQLSEGGLTSSTKVRFWVNNHLPVAVDDFAVSPIGSANGIIISVLTNDTDADGDVLTLVSIGTPSHGTALANRDNTVSYRHIGFDHTADSFTYTITDSRGGFSTAVVHINIDDGPTANDDSTNTTAGVAVNVSVLANDTDPENDPLSVIGKTDGANGTVVINPGNQTVKYTPNPGFVGSDQFTYTMWDGQVSATANVFVDVADTPQVSVVLAGPPDIYKNHDGFGIPYGGYTWFTLSRSGPTTSSLMVTFFLGGDGTAMSPPSDPCYAVRPNDFTASNCNIAPFPNGYYVIMGVGQASTDIGVESENNPSDCDGVQTVLFTIPDNPGSGYVPDPNARQANASLHIDENN